MVKQLIYILLPLCMFACQVISENEQLIPVANGDMQSRALLVEFTGFRCVNCPNAAAEAHSLSNLFGDNLVIVAMHPQTNTFCQTQKPEYNFTCPEADVYYQALGGTATTAFPTGVIDWHTELCEYTRWSANILTSVMTPKGATLHVTTTSLNNRDITISYSLDALSNNADYQILLWLVEDHYIGPQMMPDGSQNMAYEHNHILRGSIFSDPWGTQEKALVMNYTIPDSINGQAIDINNCSIVGVVLDNQTNTIQDVKQIKL